MGRVDGGVSESAKAIQRLFSDAQVPCAISVEIRKVMWTKLVWNAPFCALSCLARATVKEIMESDSLRGLALECIEEVIETAKFQGIELGPSVVEETMNLSRAIGDFKPCSKTSRLANLSNTKP
ncbi:MAG TPA: ketopantoate reductase C-terminal domain-containing protein [Candidatus Binatia bacterium]|jgi:2-dehydropantoate 2-reductase|nr:ketopantoate reductase C-terminal domain-containing protein [Candidatus Binatia bacterium]